MFARGAALSHLNVWTDETWADFYADPSHTIYWGLWFCFNACLIIFVLVRDAKVPEPPAGHRWKRVQHDNTVTWLASWVENIHGHIKYIMLNPSSKLKVKAST